MAKTKIKMRKELAQDLRQVASFLREVAKGLDAKKAGDKEVGVENAGFRAKANKGGGMTRRTC